MFILFYKHKKAPDKTRALAPPVGLEPTTLRLTAACSTTELRRHFLAEIRNQVN
jgi:hypothetical protein